MKREANRRAEDLKNSIIAGLEDRLDISVRYKSISPALLSAVTIRDLEVTFSDGRFFASRLRVFYNPINQFRGDKSDPARMISRILVDDGDIELVLREKSDDSVVHENSNNTDLLKLLTGKRVILRSVTASVKAPYFDSAEAFIERLELRYDGDDVRYNFAGNAGLSLPDVPALGSLTAEMESRGLFSPEDMSLNGRVDLISAESDLVGIVPMSIDVTYANEKLIARRIGDDKPINLSVSFAEREWEVNGEVLNLSVSELIKPANGTNAYSKWFGSSLDGSFSLASSDTLSYVLNLAIEAPENIKPAGLTAQLNITGDRETADVQELLISTEFGDFDFFGKILIPERIPVGVLALEINEDITGFPVSASFRTRYANGILDAVPIDVQTGDLVFSDFSFLLIQEEQTYSATLLAVPESGEENPDQRILVDLLFEQGPDPVVHSFISLDGLPTIAVARIFGLSNIENLPFVNDSRMNLKGFLEANRDSWVLNVEESSVISNSNTDNGITLSGRVFPDRWAMDGLHVSWNQFVADGRLFAVSSPDGGTAEGKFLVGDSIIPVSGKWFTDGKMVFQSEEKLTLEIGQRSRSGRTLQLETNDFSVPLIDGEIVTNLDVRGRMQIGDWDMFVNQADFNLLRGGNSLVFSVGGKVSPGNVALSRISLRDKNGLLTGNAVFNNSLSGRYMNGRLGMSSESGEIYEILLFKEHDDWDVKVGIESALLSRFAPGRLSGTVDMDASLLGKIEDPIISLALESKDSFFDGQLFKASAKANMSSGNLRVQDIVFNHEGLSLSRGIALMDLKKGTLRTTADLNAMLNQVPVSSGFSFALDISNELSMGMLRDPGSVDFSGTLATRPFMWESREHLPGFTFQFLKSGKKFRAQTPNSETLNLSYDGDIGKLEVLSSDPLPFVLEGGGIIRDGNLDLSFPVIGFDPQLINYIMLRDPLIFEHYVLFQDGQFIGNLDIEGPASDPNLYGTIRAEDLQVDTPYTYSDIKPASTKIHLRGNRIDVDRIEVPVGDGFVYAEGYLVIERWSITDFNMIYGARAGVRSEGVPVYYPLLGIILDGYLTGEMSMIGDGQYFDLNGTFNLPSLKASLGAPKIPVSPIERDRFPKLINLNLDFVTGNNVTFYLPNEQLKIVQATAEPNGILNLGFTSVPRTMQVIGDLPIKSGSIFYFDRDFQLTEGSLRFNENLESFDPILDLRAETRVRDDDNEDVSVILVYDSPIFSDFNPSIETIPARTDIEVLELFGQAVVPYADSESSDPNAVLLATSSVFAQAGIVQPFEEVLREGLNLDMVTLRTDIIENTLAEGLGRGSNSSDTSLSSGFGRYLDNTSLFAGKYIGDALFVSGSVSANYIEEQRNQSVLGGLEFETTLTFEMQTPFFNVAWSYEPDATISRNFVEDNKISLKWQYSF